jgi:simple sugar transport system ATP-binding protein
VKGAGSDHSGIPGAGTGPGDSRSLRSGAGVGPGGTGPGSPATVPLLAAESLSRRFGGVVALDDVSLEVRTGAVTCVLGDNGAGKSTLIRILSGVYPPSGGRILLDGAQVRFPSPRAARALGMATVHQNLAVLPLMSVWRNFVLGAEPTRGWGPVRRLDPTAARRMASEEMARMGIHLRDVDQPVGVLSGGERQSLAIARALHQGARVLILDEPTAALGVRQSELVLEHVAQARDRGAAVILITHNPAHALRAGDRFVVLTRGRVAAVRERGATDETELKELMGGESAMPRVLASQRHPPPVS